MPKLSALLTKRMKGGSQSENKMDALAQRSSSGDLSSFAGVFRVIELSVQESEELRAILTEHQNEGQEIEGDLKLVEKITAEIKAINNQAIILHGERIKRVQGILKDYRDGAFSTWLITTYGNRQTPYNFLQYFELYNSLEEDLQKQVDSMPRQVIYSLASRNASYEKKKQFIKEYKGQTREELLGQVRAKFALSEQDRRQSVTPNEQYVRQLERLLAKAKKRTFSPSIEEKKTMNLLLDQIRIILMKK